MRSVPIHVRLVISAGPRSGEVYLLTPNVAWVVGRSSDCSIPIEDSMISRRHFEIIWNGVTCVLTDLGSTNGTTLNGKRASCEVLKHDDVILAGKSAFHIEVTEEPILSPSETASPVAAPRPMEEPLQAVTQEPESPACEPARPLAIFQSAEPTLAREAVEPEEGSIQHALLRSLDRSAGTDLYAIVDGSQDLELAFTGRLMGNDVYTLFSGDMAEPVAHAGPCLIALRDSVQFLERWVETLGGNAGILLETSADLETLYAHLREIFVVEDEEGQEYFFRYYDPRVLRTYLPTCTERELRDFFGPVQRWIAEDEKAGGYSVYAIEASSVAESHVTADR